MDDERKRAEILRLLEEGEMDVDEAVRRLEEGQAVAAPAAPARVGTSPTVKRWRWWWMMPFAVGLAFTALGGWLASLGGWWWVGVVPALAVGIPLMTLAAASGRWPWVHVRIDTGGGEWPRRIAISLPLPLGVTAWLLKRFSHRLPGLDETAIDELLIALQGNVSKDEPLSVLVEEGDAGERIEVYLG